MRVALVTCRFYPQVVGSGVAAYNMAVALAHRGHDVVVITDAALQPQLDNLQLPFNTLFIDEFESFATGGAGFAHQAESLYGHILAIKPDVLHVCNYMPMLLITLMRHLIGCPVVFTFYNTPVKNKRALGYFSVPELDIALASHIVRSSSYDMLIAGSRYYYESAVRVGASPSKLKLSHLGIPLDKFAEKAGSSARDDFDYYVGSQLAPAERYILLPSRITKQKGILEAVQALALIKDTHPIKLVLTGMARPFDSRYAEHVLQEATNLGVKNQVVIPLSTIQRAHVPTFFERASLVIVPSYYEGLGLAAIEAQALKKPLIVADTVGLNEVVEHEVNGLRCLPKNSRSLADNILRLLEDNRLSKKLADRGYHTVKHFDIDRHVDDVEQVYHSLTKAGPHE